MTLAVVESTFPFTATCLPAVIAHPFPCESRMDPVALVRIVHKGEGEGEEEGEGVGVGVGVGVGLVVGLGVGFGVGFGEGFGVGAVVGFGVGLMVGFEVGTHEVVGSVEVAGLHSSDGWFLEYHRLAVFLTIY